MNEQCLSVQQEEIKAIFIKELNNRFRCLVNLDGKEILCYVPSSCKLSNFINLAGQTVILKRVQQSSNIEYALFAAETTRGLVLLNLSTANKAIEAQLYRRSFSFLGPRKNIAREATIDGYKCDLYIQDSDTLIEIKTVLSLERIAHFPTVQSERIIQQLQKIEALLEAGHKVCYLFAALSPQIKTIALDASDSFNALFKRCIDKGMVYYGCSLRTVGSSVTVASSVKVQLL